MLAVRRNLSRIDRVEHASTPGGETADTDEEDRALMTRIAAQDEAALRELMTRYGSVLMRYAGHILQSDQSQTEDVIQYAFMQVWQHAGNWQPKAKVKTWLYTITYRRCLNVLRGQKGLTRPLEEVVLVDETVNMEHDALNRARREMIDEAMQSLPERQRAALLLRYAEELPQKEAADVLEISEKALESLLSRGKAKLAQKLKQLKDDL